MRDFKIWITRSHKDESYDQSEKQIHFKLVSDDYLFVSDFVDTITGLMQHQDDEYVYNTVIEEEQQDT